VRGWYYTGSPCQLLKLSVKIYDYEHCFNKLRTPPNDLMTIIPEEGKGGGKEKGKGPLKTGNLETLAILMMSSGLKRGKKKPYKHC
jgi:hypothetical protein